MELDAFLQQARATQWLIKDLIPANEKGLVVGRAGSPFAGFLIPLFAWLARQESIRKGKAKARVKSVGRPSVVDRVDADLVVRLRGEGKSWRQAAEAHPLVRSTSGRKVRPSVGSIRRALSTAFLSSSDGVRSPCTGALYPPQRGPGVGAS